MRSRHCLSAVLAALLVGLSGERALAHHAFMAQYSCDAPVSLKGVVTLVQWTNPHTLVFLNVSEPGKPDQAWAFGGATPNTLARRGVGRDILKVGTSVTFRGYQARDRRCLEDPASHVSTCKADGRALSLADGRWIYFGSDGEGAPYDDAALSAGAPVAAPQSAATGAVISPEALAKVQVQGNGGQAFYGGDIYWGSGPACPNSHEVR